MERFTVTASINGCYSQRPTFQTNVQPTISLPPKPHLKEPPLLISYQKAPETLKPAPAEDTEISIFGAERYFNGGDEQTRNQNGKKSLPPARFGERCDLSPNPRDSSVSSVDGYGRNYRNGPFHATPTASSEASWNSQTGLLSIPPGSVPVSVRTLPQNEQRRESSSSSSCKWLFGRNCPCIGRKSVAVEENFSEPKSPNRSNFDAVVPVKLRPQNPRAGEAVLKVPEAGLEVKELAKLKVIAGNWVKDPEVFPGSGRFSPAKHLPAEIGNRMVTSGRPFNGSGGFSFPVLNQPAGKLRNQPDDPPRDSLEVFTPPEDTIIMRKSTEFQRRMSMASYAGDDGRRSFAFPMSPKARVPAIEDDLASDSSSDLFEIESFSTQTTTGPIHRRRDSLDEMPGFDPRRFVGNAAGILQYRRGFEEPATPSTAPSECYAPSEVSVEWSVTTAEGFDRASLANFSSAASDFDDSRFIQPIHERISTAIAGGGSGGKRRGNGLLSCRCEKAVNVGPLPVKFGPEQPHSGGSFPAEPGRAVGTARLGPRSSMHLPRAADICPLGRSHSARLTRPLPTR